MKTITKIDTAKFKISTVGIENSELTLDFARIIDQFQLEGNYYLIHWQARPKGYREWGIYDSRTDTYTSTEEIQISYGGWSTLQLDDKTATTIPSAVIYFKGSLTFEGV